VNRSIFSTGGRIVCIRGGKAAGLEHEAQALSIETRTMAAEMRTAITAGQMPRDQ